MTKLEIVKQLPDGGVTETVRAVVRLEETIAQNQKVMEDLAMVLGPALQELKKMQVALQTIPRMALKIDQLQSQLAAIRSTTSQS